MAGLALLLYSVAQLSSCAAASTWTSEPANRAYRWGAVRSGSRTVLKHNFLGLLRRPAISGAVLAGSSLYQRERLTSAITQSADFASTAVACAMTSRSPSRPIRAGKGGPHHPNHFQPFFKTLSQSPWATIDCRSELCNYSVGAENRDGFFAFRCETPVRQPCEQVQRPRR